MIRPDNKQTTPLTSVKLNKVPNNTAEQKPKNLLVNNQAKDLKKIENNEKKVKLNIKKEEVDIMKIKSGLKKGNNKSSFEIGKNPPKKVDQSKVTGFKNIKEMIEQNIKKQRVMSTGVIKSDKKKPDNK